jgi:hypothetical protein
MAGVMDTIKGRLGLGPSVTPKEGANAAADTFGGKLARTRETVRDGGKSRIDAAMNEALGMPPPKGQK